MLKLSDVDGDYWTTTCVFDCAFVCLFQFRGTWGLFILREMSQSPLFSEMQEQREANCARWKKSSLQATLLAAKSKAPPVRHSRRLLFLFR